MTNTVEIKSQIEELMYKRGKIEKEIEELSNKTKDYHSQIEELRRQKRIAEKDLTRVRHELLREVQKLSTFLNRMRNEKSISVYRGWLVTESYDYVYYMTSALVITKYIDGEEITPHIELDGLLILKLNKVGGLYDAFFGKFGKCPTHPHFGAPIRNYLGIRGLSAKRICLGDWQSPVNKVRSKEDLEKVAKSILLTLMSINSASPLDSRALSRVRRKIREGKIKKTGNKMISFTKEGFTNE